MAFTTLVSADTLKTHLHDPSWVVVDCRFSLDDTERGRRAYAEGHVSGAYYAHLDEVLSGPILPGKTGRHPLPDPEEFARAVAGWGVTDHTQVVVYDDAGGGVASRLWWLLRWIGHERVALLDGGWNAWQQAGGSVDTATPPAREGAVTVRLDAGLVAEAEEVASRREAGDFVLLDARAYERFAGRVEPIDPVAGHIPGARSLPFGGNLDIDGRFLPPERLKARFAPLFEGVEESDVVCYCGSGVTAAHNLLAMAHAGYPGARLYPGSWSEWITDPDRPVARE
ncbi:MAG: sulfurtransferase [Rhodothermales bacterium]